MAREKEDNGLSRRQFLELILSTSAGLAFFPKTGFLTTKGRRTARKVLVLGLDGLDPVLTAQLMKDNRLPNFKKLASAGSFLPLGSSIPPQSP